MIYEVMFAHYLEGSSDKVYLAAVPVIADGTGPKGSVNRSSLAFTYWGRAGAPHGLQVRELSPDEAVKKFGEKVRKGYERHDIVPAEYLVELASRMSKKTFLKVHHDGKRRIYLDEEESAPMAPSAPAAPLVWDHGDW